jgi:hypothetical protein
LGGSGSITNAGEISNGVYLAGGGSLTNTAGATTSGNNFGVFVGVGSGTITNNANIISTSNNGVYLQAGGSVTNGTEASISGPVFGVAVYGGSGAVINSGTISGGSDAVYFANSGANRLVVNPTAVFNGGVVGGSGAASNTLELAGGTGSISGLSGGSGTVTENGSWSFSNFGTIAVDTGGNWTLTGTNTIANLTNDGTLAIAGSLDVSTAINPSSTGVFQIGSGATFEVGAATGSQTQMSFLSSSKLVIDNAGSFGTNVGGANYAGPQLRDFMAGDTIDLMNFAAAGATLDFNSANGLLQISNGSSQVASFDFQTSTLGSGAFQVASDGHNGIFITHA